MGAKIVPTSFIARFRLIWTTTRRRSCGSRSRVTKPASSSRSTTPVMDAVVRPVARASSPAVMCPLKLRMFRQFRSVALMPIWSAAAVPMSCIRAPVRRRPAAKATSRSARSCPPVPAAGGSGQGVSQPGWVPQPGGVSPPGWPSCPAPAPAGSSDMLYLPII